MAKLEIYSHAIINGNNSGEHVTYNIRVSPFFGAYYEAKVAYIEPKVQQRYNNYTIMRRYSDFANLHWDLRDELQCESQCHLSWPMLPPAKFCGNTDPEFIESRKEQLQEYLEELLKIPGVINTDVFTQFTAEDQHKPVLRFLGVTNGTAHFREYQSFKRDCERLSEKSLDAICTGISEAMTDLRQSFSIVPTETGSETSSKADSCNTKSIIEDTISPKVQPRRLKTSVSRRVNLQSSLDGKSC